MRKWFWAALGALAVYEGIAFANRAKGDTVSEVIWSASRTHPIVPFAVGVAMGHLFWQEPGLVSDLQKAGTR